MTLAETVKVFHTGLRLIIIGATFLIVGRFILGIIPGISEPAAPTPTPTPPAEFGKIPPPQIRSLDLKSGSQPAFILDLISAFFPEAPNEAEVYPIAEPRLVFRAEDKAQKIANKFNFDGPPTITQDYYTWEDDQRRLQVDKKSLNVFYSNNLTPQPQTFIPGTFLSTSSAVKIARNILKQQGLYQNLEESKPQYQLLKLQDGSLRQALSLKDTSAVRVDFPLPPLESYPVLSENPRHNLIYVIFTGNPRSRDTYGEILELQSVRWPLLEEDASSYPLKSSRQAWDELQETKKFLVLLEPRGKDTTLPYTPLDVREFRVREIFLAYFNPPSLQAYLHPIWVFKGFATLEGLQTAEWQAYVPAVAPNWIEQASTSSN